MSHQAAPAHSATALGNAAGILGAILCLVHCIAFPVTTATAPMWQAAWLTDEWIHRGLLCLAAAVAFYALGTGYFRHRDAATVRLGLVGISFLVGAEAAAHVFSIANLETGMTMLGSLTLVSAHLKNDHHCRRSQAKFLHTQACKHAPNRAS